jgi:hypothetical protein
MKTKIENQPENAPGAKQPAGAGCISRLVLPLDLFRLPIPGLDTNEDTPAIADRIIGEWRKTRTKFRPKVLQVDVHADLTLIRILMAAGLPCAALPEAESRGRRAAQSKRYHQHSSTCEELSRPEQSSLPAQAASKSFQTHHQPRSVEMVCSTGSAKDTSRGLSCLESLKRILRAGMSLIRVPCHKKQAYCRGVKSESILENAKAHAPRSAGAGVGLGVGVVA